MKRIFALSSIFCLLVSAPAGAVGTRTFQLDSLERMSGGELKGASISPDGVVRPGFVLANSPLTDATSVFSSLAMPDGSTLVGTAPSGKVYRVAADQTKEIADTGALAVTSLVAGPDGTVYAATIPDGKIFKLAGGKSTLFATLPQASHVWALATTKQGLFAATGTEGRVYKVEASGESSIYFKSDETNIVSLAAADNGDLLAGSSGKAILYRISGPGRASVLYDFPGDEVKALAVSKSGFVYAIVNDYPEPPEPPRRTAGSRQPGPASNVRPKAGKGALYRVDTRGRTERLMKHDDTHYLSLALDEQGEPYVGTGVEGRVYTADDAHNVTLVADTDERQVGALAVTKNGGYVASGDPAVFHRILAKGGVDSTWTSKPLDCGLPARFGATSWTNTGTLELVARSGNTAIPDPTWSAWSAPVGKGQKLPVASARFVQVRARLRDADASLRDLTIPFVTENMRAVLLDVSAQPKSLITREPASSAMPSSGGELGKHDATVRITWRVDNPDNDTLRYRLSFQKDGQNFWRDLTKPDDLISKTEYDWDTSALTEGRYRVRVEATDEVVNTPADAQKHAMTSEAFVVDNTPPVFQRVTVTGRRIIAELYDVFGPIARVEYAVDGRTEFRPVAAKDGIFDSPNESVDLDFSNLAPKGSHIVVLRVFDAAGNSAMTETEIK